MRTAPKIALSLLVSLFLFSALIAASYAGLFTLLETRFYQPSVANSLENRLETISQALDQWHENNFSLFEPFVQADSVRRSLLPNQQTGDITDRARRAGELLAQNPGLSGVRIIDAGEGRTESGQEQKTRRIHFSTFDSDYLNREDSRVSYELYGRTGQEIPFEFLLVSGSQKPKLILDSITDRFIYSYPFFDTYGAWRGVAVFYVPTGSAIQYLFSRNLLRLSDEIKLIHNEDHSLSGVVLDLPRVGTELLSNVILDKWARNDLTTGRIIKTDDSGWMLVSTLTNKRYIGQVVNEDVFTFSAEIRILFLAVSFLTVFLIMFLLFNIRQDDLVIVRNRIRRFQIQLLQELMETGESAYPEKISKELTARKHDINTRIKKGFAKRVQKKHEKEIDDMLSKSWDEIVAALGQQTASSRSAIDANEIKLMLEQVLQTNAISLNLTGVPSQTKTRPQPDRKEEEIEEVEELDELDESDEVEELDELDESDEVEELDELDESDETGDAEELDELDETGEAEELDELDETGEADESESPILTDPVEPREVEYLEGEWEPELLEVATEEELNDFIQESVPDSVLVYNFEESPGLDRFKRPVLSEEDLLDDQINISGLDFSELDEDDAQEVEYTDPYPSGILQRVTTKYPEQPVYEFLEIIGDEEPSELLEMDDLLDDSDHIVSRDGIFVIAERILKKQKESTDTDFQDLVDSVLK